VGWEIEVRIEGGESRGGGQSVGGGGRGGVRGGEVGRQWSKCGRG